MITGTCNLCGGVGGGIIKLYRLAYKKKDRVKKVVKATKARSFTFLIFYTSILNIYNM